MLKFFIALMMMILPLTVSAQSQDVTIEGFGGKIAAVVQIPNSREKFPLVIICHGFTGNKDEVLLKSLADNLEREGIASIRFDFNGHGDSYGAFKDMTIPNEVEDLKKIYDWAEHLQGVTNIGVVGHSQGGVVTSMFAGEFGAKKIKAIVLMSPAAVLREDAVRGNLFDVKFDPLNPPVTVAISDGKYKVGRSYILTAQTLPIYETAEKFNGPALMIHGTGDVVVPYTYSLYYQKTFKHGTLELIDRADHCFRGMENRIAKISTEFLMKYLK